MAFHKVIEQKEQAMKPSPQVGETDGSVAQERRARYDATLGRFAHWLRSHLNPDGSLRAPAPSCGAYMPLPVYGYATGVDMTRRDLQMEARKIGRPWDVGKNVEQSSPLGLIHPATQCGHLVSGAIALTVNGQTRQSADLRDLIWPVPDIIAFLSKYYRLEAGDLIYTGTPAGVGAVVPGDEIVVHIDRLSDLRVSIGPARQE